MILSFITQKIKGRALNIEGTDNFVFAYSTNNWPAAHDSFSRESIAWLEGGALQDESTKFLAHGVLMILSFGILFPFGMFTPILREQVGKDWFLAHRGLQVLAVLLVIISFAIAVSAVPSSNHFGGTHGRLGLALFLIALQQPIMAILARHTAARQAWRVSHFFFAYLLLIAGTFNIFKGLEEAEEGHLSNNTVDKLQGFAIFGVVLVVLAMLGAVYSRYKRWGVDPGAHSATNTKGNGHSQNDPETLQDRQQQQRQEQGFAEPGAANANLQRS